MNENGLARVVKELTAAQLVVAESADQYTFRHALTHEAVYDSLLLRERKNHHRTIAETLELSYAGRLEVVFADLAFHYYKAEVWDKALEYSRRAGEKAQALYAPREASEHFTHALQSAQHLPPDPTHRNRIELHRRRAQVLEVLGELDRARADYEATLELAHAAADHSAEWQALLNLGFLWAASDYAKAGEYLRPALDLARTLDDPAILGHTLNRVGNWYTNIEQPLQALALHQEALAIFQSRNDKVGLAESYDLLGLANILSARWSTGVDAFKKAIVLFRELDDRQGLVSALSTFSERGTIYFDCPYDPGMNSLSRVTQEADEALKLARAIGWRSGEAYALTVLSGLYASYGEVGRALALAQQGLEIAEEIKHRTWTILVYQTLGDLYTVLLELETAQGYLERAFALAREIDSRLFIRQCTAWLVDVLVLKGDRASLQHADEVLTWTLESEAPWQTFGLRLCGYALVELELARGNASRALEIVTELQAPQAGETARAVTPRLWMLRGRTLFQLNRHAEAELALREALGAIPAVSNPPLALETHLALGEVYRAQRRLDLAESEFAAARKTVEGIAATIPALEMRTRFRARTLARIPTAAPL